jgi:hypothetical protein
MTEVEIEIDSDVEIVEKPAKSKTTTTTRMIPKKNISDLTDADKQTIVNDILAGREQKHYDLKTLQNGNHRIIKKKQTTTTQRISKSNNEKQEPFNPDKIYLTDNQLMMQHIIEMRDELTQLRMKQKKYKKRLNEMTYIEEDENVTEPVKEEIREPVKEEVKEVKEETKEEIPIPTPKSIKALRAQYLKR